MKTAISLGGGGSKAAFQVGAVKYLYGELGVRPDLITACSGGALNGAKLAEGGDDVPAKLEAIWRGLDTNADMWATEPWLQNLQDNARKVLEDLAKQSADLIAGVFFPPLLIAELIQTAGDAAQLADSISSILNALNTVRSIYNLGPIEAKLRNQNVLNEAVVRASSIDLRLAIVGLESGELRYILKNGTIEGRTDPPIPLADCVLTSASIPFVFSPRKIGSETYMDGGVREMVPIKAAVAAGADRIYAIPASKAGVNRQGSFDNRNVLDIMRRAAADIMPDEIQHNETNPDGGGWPTGVTLIQPRLEIYDGLTIHPGLISLNIDYGWMCARDVLGTTTDRSLCEQVTDRLMLLRRAILLLEDGSLSNAGTWYRFRGMKRLMAKLVWLRMALGSTIPPGADWWTRWEGHRRAWTRPANSPWDACVLRPYPEPAGVDAEPPPTIPSVPALTTATYGSTVVLGHWLTDGSLYSDTWPYTHAGTSGQQRVFALNESGGDDAWVIRGPHEQPLGYRWGEAVQDGQIIRLQHVNTGRNLHSHAGFPSPATGQQEVTCYGTQGIGDSNDNWRIEISGGGAWVPGKRVRLIHVNSNRPLHSHTFGFFGHNVHEDDPRPNVMLQEVAASPSLDDNDWWFIIQTTPLLARNSVFVSQAVPSSLNTGQRVTVQVTMRNTGSATWTSGGTNPYRLGTQNPQGTGDIGTWGKQRVDLPTATVPPGAEVTFSFEIQAPSAAGTYDFRWCMLQDGVEWFGAFTPPNIAIQVVVPPPARAAVFVRQTVPARIMAGNEATVQVTMRNTGALTWTNGGANPYSLGSQNPPDNQRWGTRRVPLPVATLPPGTEVTFSFGIMAPITPGTYNFQWRMIQEVGQWFGDLTTNVGVVVYPEPTR